MGARDATFGITVTAPRQRGKPNLDSKINEVFNSEYFREGIGQTGTVVSTIGGFLDEYKLTKYGTRALGPIGMLADAGIRHI